MKPTLQRYSTTPVSSIGEGEHSGCPGGTKCKHLHNLEFFPPGELAQIKESDSELVLSARKAAHRIHSDKYSGNTLAARTVELYKELVQAEGSHFCPHTLAGLLGNHSRDKPFEHEGPSRAHTMPIVGQVLGHSKHVDMHGNIPENISEETEGSSSPTSVLGPFWAESNVQYLKSSTKTGQSHSNVALTDEDPHSQDVEKWPLESAELDAKCRTDIVFYVVAGALALAAGVLFFAKKPPRYL
ncbi:uncharacterized protein K441DRAFT_674191 [Cenococcum geophilum 1.58]|uniref:uncharacterized protein n=1 Tax=Cenococcum geophilum 1.58 TaxID=794803 RepID=UPI00358E1B8B|nr:hypothetical protein K441DRAFT_674191 [Cenococcum geophilum 1.58]